MGIFGPENSQACNLIYLTVITKHLDLDSISIMLLCPLLYVTQQIFSIYFIETHQMFCQTRSKVALVEFLCLIFSQRGALVLTLSLCANMWNQHFSLIQGNVQGVASKKFEKFRNFTHTLCQPMAGRLILAYCSFINKLCTFGQEEKNFFILFGLSSRTKAG